MTTLDASAARALTSRAEGNRVPAAAGASLAETGSARHLALRPTRVHIVLWAAMLGVAVLLAARGQGAVPLGYYRDDADYLLLARSLFHAPTYGLTAYGHPQPGDTPFPFGYPLLIAPFQETPALATDGPRMLSLLATLANAALLFWGWPLLTGNRSPWWALSVSALHTLSPQVIGQASQVLSEPIFMTVVLTILMIAQRSVVGAGGWSHGVLMGLLLALAISIRTIGFFALGAAFLCILLARRRDAIAPLLAATASAAAGLLLVVSVTSADLRDLFPRQYVEMATHVDRLTGESTMTRQVPVGLSLWDYVTVRARWVILPIGGSLDQEEKGPGSLAVSDLMGLALSATCLVGFIAWVFRHGWTAYSVFAVIYALTLIFWPWSSRRYLYVIQPALYFSFLLGALAIARWTASRGHSAPLSSRAPAYLGGALAALLLLCGSYASFRDSGKQVYAEDVRERAGLLVALAMPPTMVLTEEPVLDRLYTGLPTIAYRRVTSPDELLDFMRDWGVSTILVGPKVRWNEAYERQYSAPGQEMAAALDQLIDQGHVTQTVSSGDGMVRIYRVVDEARPL